MLIDFAVGGGFAPLDLRYRADTRQLDEELARELADLVERAGLWDHQDPAVPPPPAMDARHYDLRVRQGDRTVHVQVDDASAPPALRPLLARLYELAVERGPRV